MSDLVPHLIISVYTLYALAFLDRYVPVEGLPRIVTNLNRSNIGNAYTAGMRVDLHLSSSEYQWLLTIFYISYIVRSYSN